MANCSSTAATTKFDPGNEFDCCICLNLFEDPKQLACGHICCRACIEPMVNDPGVVAILFKGNTGHKSVECPLCRKKTELSGDGQLPTAFVVKNLVEKYKEEMSLKQATDTAMGGACSICSMPVSELFYCLTCHDVQSADLPDTSLMMCSPCALKLHRKHDIVAGAEAGAEVEKLINNVEKAALHACQSAKTAEMAKIKQADDLRQQGNAAFKEHIYERAIKLYTQSIRVFPTAVCLSNRAQANIRLGRYSLAYVDANEALRMEPENAKAKMRRQNALEHLGISSVEENKAESTNANAENQKTWPTKPVRLSGLALTCEPHQPADSPKLLTAYDEHGKVLPAKIPFDQLDKFLNGHVRGPVPIFAFIGVKFDEPMVRILRQVNKERFERLDTPGQWQIGYQWFNCDFSRLSEPSFRHLLDVLIHPRRFSISDWHAMPAGFDYNALLKLRAFREASELHFDLGQHAPASPAFCMHLQPDALIDWLHAPGGEFRCLQLVDRQLEDGNFGAFLDRLIERFHSDLVGRFYFLGVLLLKPLSAKHKRLLNVPLKNGRVQNLLTLHVDTQTDIRVERSGFGRGALQFEATRVRGFADLKALDEYKQSRLGAGKSDGNARPNLTAMMGSPTAMMTHFGSAEEQAALWAMAFK